MLNKKIFPNYFINILKPAVDKQAFHWRTIPCLLQAGIVVVAADVFNFLFFIPLKPAASLCFIQLIFFDYTSALFRWLNISAKRNDKKLHSFAWYYWLINAKKNHASGPDSILPAVIRPLPAITFAARASNCHLFNLLKLAHAF